METAPTQVKKQKLVLYLTPSQRAALALTSKKELHWLQPILNFTRMSFNEKVHYLKTSPQIHVVDEVVLEELGKSHDMVALISLLTELPERNRSLKKGLRKLVEDRLRDRQYKKLIKKTLLQMYFQHLLTENKSIPRFIDTIQSPEVRSLAIEQYLLLKRQDLSPRTIQKWVHNIQDPLTHRRAEKLFFTKAK